jgi:hypothetical protein
MKQITVVLIAAALLASPVGAQNQNLITLGQAEYTASSAAVQHISESVNLKKGQEKLQLTLTYYNGTATKPGYRWLRISSASMNYVTERDFVNKTYSTDVTGDLTWGGNQLLIAADGPEGAVFGWRLTTPQPVVGSVTPQAVSPGSTIVINGTNLCPDPSGNQVTINGSPAQVISANTDKLVVQVPDDVKSGANNQVQVNVGGVSAGALPLTVNGLPYLSGLSRAWLPPGAPLTIYGENFTGNANSVVVFIGPLRAPVVSSSVNSITVTAPADFGGMPWGYYMPVKVIINGVKARNQLTVSCSEVG